MASSSTADGSLVLTADASSPFNTSGPFDASSPFNVYALKLATRLAPALKPAAQLAPVLEPAAQLLVFNRSLLVGAALALQASL
jgi:hypothetical protein